jgi:hypothetical protein
LDFPHQNDAIPSPDAGTLPAESEREKAPDQIKHQEKQRILGMVPQFNVSNVSNAIRLDPQQKFELAFKSAVDPATFLFTGISSAISQAKNSFPGYGQGAVRDRIKVGAMTPPCARFGRENEGSSRQSVVIAPTFDTVPDNFAPVWYKLTHTH